MQTVRENIRKHGFFVQGVFPTKYEPGELFLYTIGFWQKWQHPEIVIFGVPPEVAHQLLWNVWHHVEGGGRIQDGQQVPNIAEGYLAHFRSAPTNHPRYSFGVARAYYGHSDFEVLQLVIPDEQGRWPWEPGYPEGLARSQQALVEE